MGHKYLVPMLGAPPLDPHWGFAPNPVGGFTPLTLRFSTHLKGEGDVKVHGRVKMGVWWWTPSGDWGGAPLGSGSGD